MGSRRSISRVRLISGSFYLPSERRGCDADEYTMTDEKLQEDIQKARNKHRKRPVSFWGLSIAILSILYGEFIIRVEDFLLGRVEPYFQQLPVEIIGVLLIIAGAIKLLGILTNNLLLRKIGIWSLCGIWSGLFILAMTFSFGTGYPHQSYMFNGFVLAICFRVSYKGSYDE